MPPTPCWSRRALAWALIPGLPDFRGLQGFWRAYPVIAKLGLSFEEMANPAWFSENPHLAWAFYGHRLNLYRQTTPHQGFSQLLEIGAAKPAGYFVFTSNVDGHFQKAGFTPERIVECHGSIHHFQCTASCTDRIWDAEGETVNIEESTFRALEPLPKCRNCPALARPNILMFGDWSWLGHRTEAQQERFSKWLNELAKSSAKLAVVELGAGSAIPTVGIPRSGSWSVSAARSSASTRESTRFRAATSGCRSALRRELGEFVIAWRASPQRPDFVIERE